MSSRHCLYCSLFVCLFDYEWSLLFSPRLVVLSVVLFGLPYGSDQSCSVTLVDHGRGYLGILVSCLICESAIMWLSMRGSILYTQPREAVQYVIYIRLGTRRGSLLFPEYSLSVVMLFGCITSILLVLSLSSYSVGGVGVRCGGNRLARPVLPAML